MYDSFVYPMYIYVQNKNFSVFWIGEQVAPYSTRVQAFCLSHNAVEGVAEQEAELKEVSA